MRKHEFEPPPTAQALDELIRHIDAGEGDLASLSDEQRAQLRCELCDAWLENYLDDFRAPENLETAIEEYRAIASGARYPHLPEDVRRDLLIRFDDVHGEGGPDHWPWPDDQGEPD